MTSSHASHDTALHTEREADGSSAALFDVTPSGLHGRRLEIRTYGSNGSLLEDQTLTIDIANMLLAQVDHQELYAKLVGRRSDSDFPRELTTVNRHWLKI